MYRAIPSLLPKVVEVTADTRSVNHNDEFVEWIVLRSYMLTDNMPLPKWSNIHKAFYTGRSTNFQGQISTRGCFLSTLFDHHLSNIQGSNPWERGWEKDKVPKAVTTRDAKIVVYLITIPPNHRYFQLHYD